MRRHDKSKHIEKLNSFLNEHHDGEFSNTLLNKNVDTFLDELKQKDEDSYNVVERIIEKYF